MTSGIYQIRNTINGNIYIGQTRNLKKRMRSHFLELSKNRHHNRYLQRSYNLYGDCVFVFEVLLYCEHSELTKYEQFFVDNLNPEYNICTLCVDSSYGVRRTDETKRKQSIFQKGKVMSTESRIKISLSERGEKHYMFGKHHTNESKEKMRVAKLGKHLTDEAKKKLSNSIKGEKHYNYGKHRSEETKIKLSMANKGKHPTKETIEKMSISIKESWKRRKQRENYEN